VPPKSSKEIAREAVEQEFQQHKRKRNVVAVRVDLPTKMTTMTTVTWMTIRNKEGTRNKTRRAEGQQQEKNSQRGGKERKAVSNTAIEPGTAGR
jgi:hypothetical protein